MAITRAELLEHCKSIDLHPNLVEGDEDTFLLLYSTDSFIDEAGDKEVTIWCTTGYEGEYFCVAAPRVLNTTGCKYKGALFAAMAEVALRTPYLQLTHNPENGEVHLEIEVPVADNTITARQLEMMIEGVVMSLDRFYPVLRHAMDTGKIDFSLCWEAKE